MSKNFIHALVKYLAGNDNSKKAAKELNKSKSNQKVEAGKEAPKDKTNPLAALVVIVKRVLHSLTNLAKTSPSSSLALATALQGPSHLFYSLSILLFNIANDGKQQNEIK